MASDPTTMAGRRAEQPDDDGPCDVPSDLTSDAKTMAPATIRDAGTFERLTIDDARWAEFVDEREDALAFHRPAWTETLASTYGFEPFALALSRGGGSIVAGMPVVEIAHVGKRHWVSLPFSDVCQPLGDPADVNDLVAAIHGEPFGDGHVRGIEIRSAIEDATANKASHGVIHELPLSTDLDAVRSTFSKSQVRRNIARSQREGVVVRRGESPEALLEVFLRLHTMTRRRQGLPTQPLKFFQQLQQRIMESGHGFVLVSYVDDSPAAAAVFLLGHSTVTYKYGASDTKYWPRRPNHLLFWEAIRWSCEHGYRRFDFGRSDWENESLRKFKSSWGGIERELVYSSLGKRPFEPGGPGMSIAKAMIRHSPMWLNRRLGQLLYRFAA